MKASLQALSACVALGAAASPAHAMTAEEILAKLDEGLNRADDQFFSYDIVDQQQGKDERRMGIDVWVQREKRFTEFTAPADVRGTKVLILSQTQMYVYLPAFKKVRRVASHVKNQGFLGTTYSNDDMGLARFADKYTAKMLEETDALWKLELAAKPESEAPYPKIVLTVEKERVVPTVIDYFDASGTKLKTETREEYACQERFCTPGVFKMVDHTKNGHWTKLVRKKWKVNTGMGEDVFSKRNLARGQ